MTASDSIIDLKEVFIVIPAKDEERYIDLLINELEALGFTNIILVNDSSIDNTRQIAENRPNVTVLDHVINLGAGAATQTGIAYAVEHDAQMIATIDADLQHNPKDLIKLITHCIETESDLVIGSRFLKPNNIPKSRIFYNKVGNIISYFLTGKYLTDSQSGMKIITNGLARSLDINYDGFEFCMEIIKQAHINKSKIAEVPIDVLYTEETTKKGQNLGSGLRMLSRIFSPFA